MFCQEQLGGLKDKKELFEKAGAQVIVIGQGEQYFAKEVCKEYGNWYRCVGDPERKSFALYGLGYTSYPDLTSENVKSGAKRARGSGFKQNWGRTFATDSDWLQLAGTCVIDTKGKIWLMDRAKDVAYQADIPKILKTVEEIKKSASQ